MSGAARLQEVRVCVWILLPKPHNFRRCEQALSSFILIILIIIIIIDASIPGALLLTGPQRTGEAIMRAKKATYDLEDDLWRLC